MALTRTEINQIVAKMQTSADLGAGGISALKEVLNGINLGDAPEDGTTYGREDGEWVAVAAGGGNSVTVTVDFGASFSQYAETVVTGQTWVTAGSEITATPLASHGQEMEVAVLSFQPVVTNIVAGTGFTLAVFAPYKARDTYTFSCIGV